jgi:hypothetical protein
MLRRVRQDGSGPGPNVQGEAGHLEGVRLQGHREVEATPGPVAELLRRYLHSIRRSGYLGYLKPGLVTTLLSC